MFGRMTTFDSLYDEVPCDRLNQARAASARALSRYGREKADPFARRGNPVESGPFGGPIPREISRKPAWTQPRAKRRALRFTGNAAPTAKAVWS